LKKRWRSVYYSFFEDDVKIKETKDGRQYLEFTCIHPNCSATVNCFLDKGDATSTGGLQYHVEEACKAWGPGIKDAVTAAKEAKSVADGRSLALGYARTKRITHHFERKKGKITYSIQNHTFQEAR
jgi:hypothetical protein